MVRGVLTQQVMEAGAARGSAGRRADDGRADGAADSSIDVVPADQKRPLIEDARLAAESNTAGQAAGGQANAGTRGLPCPYTVKEEERDDRRRPRRLQRLRAFVRRDGDPVPVFAMANNRHRDVLERQRGMWSSLRSAPISR